MTNSPELKYAQGYLDSMKKDYTKKTVTLHEIENILKDLPALEQSLVNLKSEPNPKWWKSWPPFSFKVKLNTLDYLLANIAELKLSPTLIQVILEQKRRVKSDRTIFYLNSVVGAYGVFMLILAFGGFH